MLLWTRRTRILSLFCFARPNNFCSRFVPIALFQRAASAENRHTVVAGRIGFAHIRRILASFLESRSSRMPDIMLGFGDRDSFDRAAFDVNRLGCK